MRSMMAVAVLAVSVVTAAGVRAVHAQGQAGAAGAPPGAAPGAPQGPKNLQVLPKDWTAQQVQQYMRANMIVGLGVQCTYCHVADRSSDELKTKVTARKMLQMVAIINDVQLKDVGEPAAAGAQKVTCYTCHRGTTKPLTGPPAGGIAAR